MSLEVLKPLLTALVLPPALPLLMAVAGHWLTRRARLPGRLLFWIGMGSAWLFSCNGAAVWLSHSLLPTFQPATVADLKAKGVQAVVVLGGGMHLHSDEYGSPQLSAPSLVRLRYGAWLARSAALPLAFSGGVGWASVGTGAQPEAAGAMQAAHDFGVSLRWADDQSRDTLDNASRTAQLLRQDGINRIALVSHAWHLPRAVAAFEDAGLRVLPAPTAYIQTESRGALEWLPSGEGLYNSRNVWREYLGIRLSSLTRWLKQI